MKSVLRGEREIKSVLRGDRETKSVCTTNFSIIGEGPGFGDF